MHQNKAKRSQNESNGEKLLGSALKQRRIENLKPFRFKPGQSGNPNGRPKSLDQLRARAQELAKDGSSDNILEDWANSKDVRKQELFMWYAYGKPPDKVETIIDDKRTLHLHWPHERPDLATETNGNGHERN